MLQIMSEEKEDPILFFFYLDLLETVLELFGAFTAMLVLCVIINKNTIMNRTVEFLKRIKVNGEVTLNS